MSFPAIKGLNAQYFGASGGATSTSYFVQAVYPGGKSPMSSAVAITIPAATSNDNKVLLKWEPAPGALYYDIFKNTTGTTPSGVVTALLATGRTYNAYTDDGATLVSVNAGVSSDLNLQTATDTATLVASQVIGNPAVLVATPTAAAALTTPTAALMLAAMGNPVANVTMFRLIVKNTSAGANTITMTAGSGVTITGTATIAQSTFREFLIYATSASAVTMLAVESGTF